MREAEWEKVDRCEENAEKAIDNDKREESTNRDKKKKRKKKMKKTKEEMEEGEIDDVSEMREPLLEKVGQIESRSPDWTL